MIRYVPSSAAEPLSQSLWGLSRPEHLRDADETRYLFSWIIDNGGNRWLVVPTDYTINVHPEAVLDGIADILQPWIDAGHLPSDTNAELASLVESLQGKELVVYDAFPQLFKNMSKDLPQMIYEGLLTQPSMP